MTVGATMPGSGVEVGVGGGRGEGIYIQTFLLYLSRWVVFQSYYISGLIFNVYIFSCKDRPRKVTRLGQVECWVASSVEFSDLGQWKALLAAGNIGKRGLSIALSHLLICQ